MGSSEFFDRPVWVDAEPRDLENILDTSDLDPYLERQGMDPEIWSEAAYDKKHGYPVDHRFPYELGEGPDPDSDRDPDDSADQIENRRYDFDANVDMGFAETLWDHRDEIPEFMEDQMSPEEQVLIESGVRLEQIDNLTSPWHFTTPDYVHRQEKLDRLRRRGKGPPKKGSGKRAGRR